MSDAIKKFISNLRYVAHKPPQQIIEDLNEVDYLNCKYAQSRQKYRNLLVVAILLAIASFLLLLTSSSSFSFNIVFLTIASISVICICYFSLQCKKYARIKIEPYRYLLAKKLTDLLQRDLSEKSNLDLNLDFTKPIIQPKLISEGNHPLKSGWRLKIYRDSWFNIQGEFCDCTNFDLHITEHHRNASGWKRSRSGKRKHKSKNKFKGSEISLQLRYPSKKYGAIQVLQQDAMDAIKLPNYVEIKNFKLNSKLILLKVNLPPQFDIQTNYSKGMSDEHKTNTTYKTVTAMFLSLYQILNLARSLSK